MQIEFYVLLCVSGFKDTPKRFFLEKFDGIIWRIEADPFSPLLGLEIRHPDKKQVSFACIDTHTGRILWKNIQTPEPWLHSLQTVVHGIVLIHGYASPVLPQPSGIIAIDKQGTMAWENYADTFTAVLQDGIAVYNAKIEPRKYRVLDIQTGRAIRTAEKRELNEQAIHASLLFPESFQPDEEDLQSWKAFFHETEIDASEAECLIRQGLTYAGVYTKNGKLLDHHLLVYGNDHVLLMKETLSEASSGKAPDSFFIWGNLLLCLKNKSELGAYLV